MNNVVIVSGSRTAIGALGGALKQMPTDELGAIVIKDVLEKADLLPVTKTSRQNKKVCSFKNLPDSSFDSSATPVVIDEVIMGNVLETLEGKNPAYSAARKAGIPGHLKARSVNRIFGSGMLSVAQAAHSIRNGDADVAIAGGMENISKSTGCDSIMENKRIPDRNGGLNNHDVYNAFFKSFYGCSADKASQRLMKKFDIDFEEQREFIKQSHNRACEAIEKGYFQDEIVPIMLNETNNGTLFFDDESPFNSCSKNNSLDEVKNSTDYHDGCPGINDGAAALLLMSEKKSIELGIEPLARISGFAHSCPGRPWLLNGPVHVVNMLSKKTGIDPKNYDIFEAGEVLCSQAIEFFRELGLDPEYPNRQGNSVSFGHPVGCSGSRIIVSSIYQMRRRKLGNSMIVMCTGDGSGMGMFIER